MKKYFFGFLFVRMAKILAIIVVLWGIGFTLFEFEQAAVASEAARYSPSPTLRQQVDMLITTLAEAQRLSADFTKTSKETLPVTSRTPSEIRSVGDFLRLKELLRESEAQGEAFKRSIVEPFETLVGEIQNKLRAYAATISPPQELQAPPATPQTAPTPGPIAAKPRTLFSDRLTAEEIQNRLSELTRVQQFLKSLPVENPENQIKLSDSAEQLENLKGLLPSQFEVPIQETPKSLSSDRQPMSQKKSLNADKVADELDGLRALVRRAILSSWALDDAITNLRRTAASEENTCRLATLAVKRIWLATFGIVSIGVIAALFVAFLTLVMADVTQTLLDTAINTATIAARR